MQHSKAFEISQNSNARFLEFEHLPSDIAKILNQNGFKNMTPIFDSNGNEDELKGLFMELAEAWKYPDVVFFELKSIIKKTFKALIILRGPRISSE